MAKLTQFGLDAPIAPPGDARHKRSFPRVPSQLGQHDEEVESPLPNAWPSGLRTMGCLACDARFISSGRTSACVHRADGASHDDVVSAADRALSRRSSR